MNIDPSTSVGKLRLRVGDFSDFPYLPDSVYLQTLTDNNGNLGKTATTCAMYILGILSFKTHRKMSLQLEVWGAEAFQNYKAFLLMLVKDPAFSLDSPPIPYTASGCDDNQINQFISDWKENFVSGTESQQLATNALYSPNNGSTYGWGISSSEGL